MKTTMTFDEARTWAIISNDILPFYIPNADSYGVAWGKYILAQKQAVLIISNALYNMPITPAMKEEAFNEFVFICNMFDFPLEIDMSKFNALTHYSWITLHLRDAINKIKESKDSNILLKLIE